MKNEKPTPQQIKNLRDLAQTYFGPWAYMMPEKDVVKFRDWFQAGINEDAERSQKKETKKAEPQRPQGFILGGLNNKIV